MIEWMPIETKPPHKMPVLYYSTTLRFWDGKGDDNILPQMPEEGRDEAFELGFFDGDEFHWNGTGHALFEFDYDEGDPQKPTHWMPLPDPPK